MNALYDANSVFGVLFFPSVFALAVATPVAAADPTSVPGNFRARIGGFLGGNDMVELRDNVLTYSARPTLPAGRMAGPK